MTQHSPTAPYTTWLRACVVVDVRPQPLSCVSPPHQHCSLSLSSFFFLLCSLGCFSDDGESLSRSPFASCPARARMTESSVTAAAAVLAVAALLLFLCLGTRQHACLPATFCYVWSLVSSSRRPNENKQAGESAEYGEEGTLLFEELLLSKRPMLLASASRCGAKHRVRPSSSSPPPSVTFHCALACTHMNTDDSSGSASLRSTTARLLSPATCGCEAAVHGRIPTQVPLPSQGG